jgi:hypothetical protein
LFQEAAIINPEQKIDQSSKPGGYRRLLVNAALVLGGIAVALGMVGIFFLFFPQFQPGVTVFTAGMGDLFVAQQGVTAPPPNPDKILDVYFIHYGDDGFRVPARTADHYDVLALGDSYTEAGNVGKPWPDTLARDSGLTVRNLGFRGWGPVEEARAMEIFGADADADYVIISLFDGNDFSDAAFSLKYREDFVLPADELKKIKEQQENEDFQLPSPDDGPFKYPLQININGQESDMVFFEAYAWWLNIERETFERSTNYQIIKESWQEIVDLAGDACVIVTYFPSKEHIYVPYLNEHGRVRLMESAFVVTASPDDVFYISFDLPVGTFDDLLSRLDNQRDAVANLAGELGLPFADLTPAFQQAAATGQILYYVYDTHWNQAGHDLAGQVLADFIASDPCQK